MYLPHTLFTWCFLITATAQACLIIAIEAYVFAKFQDSLSGHHPSSNSQTIPTYLSLFIFGFVYQTILIYDSLRLKNTIQVIGLCLYNLGMLIYAAVQFDQIDKVIKTLSNVTDPSDVHIDHATTLWHNIRPYLIAVPCIIAFFSVVLGFEAWKLYDEFAWTIYKHISADLQMKRRFLKYQIYIALLKFDFFFFLGFTVQFLVIVSHQKVSTGGQITTAEFALTIAAIPITILILLMGAWCTRRENKPGSIAVLCAYVAGLAYFIFKLVRMYQQGHELPYKPVRNSLTVFAAITVLLITGTIANAIVCLRNFDKGLLPYVRQRKIGSEEEKAAGMTELNDVSRHGPTKIRMEID